MPQKQCPWCGRLGPYVSDADLNADWAQPHADGSPCRCKHVRTDSRFAALRDGGRYWDDARGEWVCPWCGTAPLASPEERAQLKAEEDIEILRQEAEADDDLDLVAVCDLALGYALDEIPRRVALSIDEVRSALERWGITPESADAVTRARAECERVIREQLREEIGCECGYWSGEACCWRGPESETVVVEYMPEYLRASHRAAGNSGIYPANGAVRLRVERSCADRIIEDAGEWARVLD